MKRVELDQILNLGINSLFKIYLEEDEFASVLKTGIDSETFTNAKNAYFVNKLKKVAGSNELMNQVFEILELTPSVGMSKYKSVRKLELEVKDLCYAILKVFGAHEKRVEIDRLEGQTNLSNFNDNLYNEDIKKKTISVMKKILKERRKKLMSCVSSEDFIAYTGERAFLEHCQKFGVSKEQMTHMLKDGRETEKDALTTFIINIDFLANAVPFEFPDELANKIDPLKLGLLLATKDFLHPDLAEHFQDGQMVESSYRINMHIVSLNLLNKIQN